MGDEQTRRYARADSVVFLRTKDEWGGLSNMAPGYPVSVCGIRIRSVEALYQACRFPEHPEVQRHVIDQVSPMAAKIVSRSNRKLSRSDWQHVRVRVMRWCLRVKLAQHGDRFGHLLLSTGTRPIVEESRRDTFWGAAPEGGGYLGGMNVLGRLLMELREGVAGATITISTRVDPPGVPDFTLAGQPIGVLGEEDAHRAAEMYSDRYSTQYIQEAFFD